MSRFSPGAMHRAALLALLVASAVFGLLTLVRYPAPFDDEAWNASRSWALLQTGHPFGTMDAGAFENFPGYWNFFARLGTWLHAGAIWALGPSLFSVRLVSLLFGIGLLLAIYFIARNLYNRTVGLVAVALLALSESFLYSSHLARHDIIVAAMGFGAVALYFGLVSRAGTPRARSILASILCGLLIGLTLDIHFNGVIYLPVVVALFAFDYRFSMIKQWSFWAFLAGFAIGVAYFFLVHFAQYPEAYFSIGALGNPIPRTPPAMSLDPRDWLGGLMTMLALFIDDWRSPLAVIAIVMLAYRRTCEDKRLLVLTGALLLAFAGTVRYGTPPYAILITPVGDLLIAVLLYRLYRQRAEMAGFGRYAFTALAWVLIGASVVSNLSPMTRDFDTSYDRILSELRKNIPAGSSVLGFPIYWFAHPQDPYYIQQQLYYYHRYYPQSTLDDVLRYFAPDYIIVSENRELEFYMSPIVARLARQYYAPYVPDSDTELKRLAEEKRIADEHGDLVLSMTTRWFGQLYLYKMDWTDSGSAAPPAHTGAP